nr:hypothetical protein [Candidatus Sigynarchaeota archaeon]
ILLKLGFLGRFVANHVDDPLVKAIAIVIFWNIVSLAALVFVSSYGMFASAKACLIVVDFLFMPGFTLTLGWYPLKTSKFKPRPKKSPPLYTGGSGTTTRGVLDGNSIDWITRIAYSICFSIALVVLFGFLIVVLLGFGFNVILMHGMLSLIEILVIIGLFKNIMHSLDPYRMI